MKALVDAGADAIFPEALKDLGEFEQVCAALDVPVLANMTEFGEVRAVHPRATRRDRGRDGDLPRHAAARRDGREPERVLETILAEGTQQSRVPEMLTRARLYELVDYEGYNRFDASVFDFEVPAAHRTSTTPGTPPSIPRSEP